MQKQPAEVFYKKAVRKNFAIVTGKHLCWSLLLESFGYLKNIYFENICKRPEAVAGGVLRNFTKFTGKQLCQSLFFKFPGQVCNFIKKETLTQVFSCEFREISKSTFSYRTPVGCFSTAV